MSPQTPTLRPYARGPVPVQTAEEAAAFDRRAIDDVGVPQPVLMENAGRSAAMVLRAVHGRPGRAVAVVGTGNNGGDALVVARALAAWGSDVRILLVADRPVGDPLLHGWPLTVLQDGALGDADVDALFSWADVVVDGILGTGVRGAPRERQARVIGRLNASGRPVVALDVPSGVDATSGRTPGAVVHAATTVSFGAPKLGALLHPARAHVGRHVSVEIGFPPLTESDASAFAVTPAWALARVPRRDTDTHKNRVGRTLIVGGGKGMAGAVILAARASFRAGAGLVQVASVAENRETIQSALPEAIFIDVGEATELSAALEEADAVAVGPGLGTGDPSADILLRSVSVGMAPLLLDADALNLIAAGVVDLASLSSGRPTLITPHPGEMARLLDKGGKTDGSYTAGASPAEIAREAVRRFGCTVLYKGAPSVVVEPEGMLAVDTQSSSDLAVAGMGDTLAGVCAALAAQGADPLTAGALGLYLSGRAARLASRGAGLTPSDVAERIPDALTERGEPETDLDAPFVLFDADPAD